MSYKVPQNTALTLPSGHVITAIIFDHDGTLVDSETVHCACWNQVLHAFSAHMSFESYCSEYNGLPTLETAKRLRARFNIPLPTEALYSRKIHFLNEQLAQQPFPLLPYVRTTLEYLHNKIPLAIASGANKHEVAHSVNTHAIAPFFNAIATKNDVQNSKPAPDVYNLAAKLLGKKPKECLAIEDSNTGYQAAINARMLCLRLTNTPQNTYEFTDMSAILAFLKNLIEQR